MPDCGNGWIPKEINPGGDPERLILVWHVFLECWTDRAYNWTNNRFYTHWQEAPTTGWIRTQDRMPQETDGDAMHCVMVANDDLSILRVTGWHQLPHHPEYTQWQHTFVGPTGYMELKKEY